ncbi:Pseudouridylate synthase 7-like protein [Camponotus floridanus]|uniref:Pseudouridylate synthase 7-like protein n=1 Tax=Camponotus floridanus TaxID=104421 RepID=E2AR47_CAMFO|nr:pseudouridylate synthase 7 homolog [Camponotus floridanus]EFN64086.1 Pseudouridylate synthase 7-like protein [Camponotus floridanus]
MSADNITLPNKNFAKRKYQNNKNRNRRSEWKGGCQNNSDRRGFKRNFDQSSEENAKRNKLDVGIRLKECDLGITEYISKHPGFSAIIKERYTDFHVNEIDLDGQVAKLTHQNIPSDSNENINIEDLKTMISSVIWDQLQVLKENPSSTIQIDVTNIDKTERRIIHTIAQNLANVISQTTVEDDKKFITIIPKNTKTDHKVRKDNRINWKNRDGDYCHFLLHKVNMDTIDALNQLAINLRIQPNNFTYPGTKDRRAWTTQWVSLKRVDARDILRASKRTHGAYVGNFKYAKNSLKLGMLRGNQFKIALRNVCGTDEEIEQAMTSVRDNGFINYYGLQRFGTVASIPTHEIGKRLLQGKWHEAIELILKPRPGEQDKELAEARQIYAETKDAHTAYAKIKRIDKIEARLLKGLQVSGEKNPLGALDSIPRNIRLMYIHAYQSFVWNHIVSRRIKQFGTNVIVGDLVYDKQSCQENVTDEIMNYPLNDGDVRETDVISSEEINIDSEASKTNEESLEQNNFSVVKSLKEEDLPNYTLADVVMPQPGWKVTYPSYAKAWYGEFLAKDELTTDLKQNNKKYSLSGAYRKILQIPMKLSWKIMYYKNKHDNLILSDIDQMRKIASPQNDPDGKNKALIIEMSLEPSTYATMGLREILKNDTSAETQVALSASYDAENVQSSTSTVSVVV